MRNSTTLVALLAASCLAATTALAASGPHGVQPRDAIVSGVKPPMLSVSLCSDSTEAPWASIGLGARPSWVNQCAERRLRLLPALPAMEQHISADADKYFGAQGPGLAVGLVLDDGLYYSQGFGFRDAQKTNAPDEITIFRAGSLSKVITGTGLLTLIDDPQRHMSLDDAADNQKYLPELEFVCPASSNGQAWQTCARGSNHLGIKLKDLVSHTAGLADVMEQNKADVGTWLSDLKKSYLLFAPEKYSSYSGVSIEGVGLIEQRVSGALSYPSFIEKNLFTPLGMTHSSMDPTKSPANLVAQRWRFNLAAPYTSWSFVSDGSMLAGDDQAMILPAGGLATDVWDLSRFMKMWLSGAAPNLNGHPILKASTIQSANLPQASSNAAPPPGCGNASDPNGFYYSGCGAANGFGVNWYVGNKPYIMHNGDEPGYSGSETMIDQPAKMAATGLVSTEPYPNVPKGKTQPMNLDGGFIDTVVGGRLMNEGLAGDAKATWKGGPLPEGTARLLWLSGVKPPASLIGSIGNPNYRPPLVEHPNEARPSVPPKAKATPQSVQPQNPQNPTQETPLHQYENQLLDQFSASFRAEKNLTAANVQAFVQDIFGDASRCSTFRVRRVFGPDKVSLRLQCHQGKTNVAQVFDVTLTVSNAGRIKGVEDAGITNELY